MPGLENLINPIFRFFYRRRRPLTPGERKPWIQWLPKYTFDVFLPEPLLQAEDPHSALEARLAPLGFSLLHWTREEVVYARGKSWGDFSIKLVRLNISFALPLAERTPVLLEVKSVCAFDTGDLWKLAHEVKATVEDQEEDDSQGEEL